MKNNRILPLTLIVAALLAGCSSLPANNTRLDEARSDYNNAQANPQVTALAAGELRQASNSLDRANAAWSKDEDRALVDHLAYVAKQEVAIARETADQKAAELAVTNAAAERDAVRLEARTREAETAQRSAQYAQRQSEASQRQSEAAQRSAEQSRRESEAARSSAQDAQSRAILLEQQLREMEAKKTDRGMVVTLGDVLFDTNEAQLKSGGMRNVQKVADFFRQYPQRKVLIEGFTDSTGSDGLNQQLSDRRAGAVRTALLDMGMGAERITSRGYGESYPVAGNDTAAGRQMNRRVELVVSDDNGMIVPR